jgi:cold shock CspA family protein
METSATTAGPEPGPHLFGCSGPRSGQVVAFDPGTGLGIVRDHLGKQYPFHCTEVADGSRNAEAGQQVVFRVGAGHLGRWEAREITAAVPPL